MDMLSRLMAYEDGGLPVEEVIELFQELVDTGVVWQLQGHYGRTAQGLIEAGLVTRKPLFEVVAGHLAEDHRTNGPVCEAADWLANCGHDSCYLIQEEQETLPSRTKIILTDVPWEAHQG